MSTKSSPKPKPRTRPAKAKGGQAAGKSPAGSKPTKPKAARPKAGGGGKDTGTGTTGAEVTGARRLRPGELDGLVVAHMREHPGALPIGPGAVAKGIGRSSGAVGNCLERLAKAETSPVRRANEKPRAYDLEGESGETPA
jgi:hypothetical protein